MRLYQIAGSVVLAAIVAGCTDAPSVLGPRKGPSADVRGLCSVSDDAATKTRTVTGACTNTGVSVPDGWRVQAGGEAPALGVSKGARSGVSLDVSIQAFTQLTQPTAAYTSATTKLDISRIPLFTDVTSITDGNQT